MLELFKSLKAWVSSKKLCSDLDGTAFSSLIVQIAWRVRVSATNDMAGDGISSEVGARFSKILGGRFFQGTVLKCGRNGLPGK